MFSDARALIREKGVAALSEATNKAPGAIRLWKHRNKIPRDAWPEIVDAFPDVTLDLLRKLEGAA